MNEGIKMFYKNNNAHDWVHYFYNVYLKKY